MSDDQNYKDIEIVNTSESNWSNSQVIDNIKKNTDNSIDGIPYSAPLEDPDNQKIDGINNSFVSDLSNKGKMNNSFGLLNNTDIDDKTSKTISGKDLASLKDLIITNEEVKEKVNDDGFNKLEESLEILFKKYFDNSYIINNFQTNNREDIKKISEEIKNTIFESTQKTISNEELKIITDKITEINSIYESEKIKNESNNSTSFTTNSVLTGIGNDTITNIKDGNIITSNNIKNRSISNLNNLLESEVNTTNNIDNIDNINTSVSNPINNPIGLPNTPNSNNYNIVYVPIAIKENTEAANNEKIDSIKNYTPSDSIVEQNELYNNNIIKIESPIVKDPIKIEEGFNIMDIQEKNAEIIPNIINKKDSPVITTSTSIVKNVQPNNIKNIQNNTTPKVEESSTKESTNNIIDTPVINNNIKEPIDKNTDEINNKIPSLKDDSAPIDMKNIESLLHQILITLKSPLLVTDTRVNYS